MKMWRRDFPGGPLGKNMHGISEDIGLIPGQGTKISHDSGGLSLCTTLESQCAA